MIKTFYANAFFIPSEKATSSLLKRPGEIAYLGQRFCHSFQSLYELTIFSNTCILLWEISLEASGFLFYFAANASFELLGSDVQYCTSGNEKTDGRGCGWTKKVEKAKHSLASYITPYVLTCDVNTGAPKPPVLPNPPNGGFM